jgi:hypothetical protein
MSLSRVGEIKKFLSLNFLEGLLKIFAFIMKVIKDFDCKFRFSEGHEIF